VLLVAQKDDLIVGYSAMAASVFCDPYRGGKPGASKA
jgi:hypothetical protein